MLPRRNEPSRPHAFVWKQALESTGFSTTAVDGDEVERGESKAHESRGGVFRFSTPLLYLTGRRFVADEYCHGIQSISTNYCSIVIFQEHEML